MRNPAQCDNNYVMLISTGHSVRHGYGIPAGTRIRVRRVRVTKRVLLMRLIPVPVSIPAATGWLIKLSGIVGDIIKFFYRTITLVYIH